jgi:hypothetical protein
MLKLLFIVIITALSTSAVALSTRIVDADSLYSADHLKQYTLPSTSGTIALLSDVAGGTTVQETASGPVNDSNVAFTVAHTPTDAGNFMLFLDGLLLNVTDDYTRSGVNITMISAPKTGQKLRAVYKY